MYTTTEVLAAVTAPTAAAVILPNTGASESIVAIAVTVVAGLTVWAIMYKRANR